MNKVKYALLDYDEGRETDPHLFLRNIAISGDKAHDSSVFADWMEENRYPYLAHIIRHHVHTNGGPDLYDEHGYSDKSAVLEPSLYVSAHHSNPDLVSIKLRLPANSEGTSFAAKKYRVGYDMDVPYEHAVEIVPEAARELGLKDVLPLHGRQINAPHINREFYQKWEAAMKAHNEPTQMSAHTFSETGLPTEPLKFKHVEYHDPERERGYTRKNNIICNPSSTQKGGNVEQGCSKLARNEVRQFSRGYWLSPSGKLHDIGEDYHTEWMFKHAPDLGIVDDAHVARVEARMRRGDVALHDEAMPHTIAFAKGWHKITLPSGDPSEENVVHSENWDENPKPLTPEQHGALVRLAKSNDLDEIYHTHAINRRNRVPRPIWTNKDRLSRKTRYSRELTPPIGWLSPQGEFHKIDPMGKGHLSWLNNNYDIHGVEIKQNPQSYEEAYHPVFEAGWHRVVPVFDPKGPKELLVENHKHYVNDAQRDALIQIAKSHGMDIVTHYQNPYGSGHVLWRNKEKMNRKRYSRPNLSEQLRVLDLEMLTLLENKLPIPRELLDRAIELRMILTEQGQDNGFMPLKFKCGLDHKERYAADQPPTIKGGGPKADPVDPLATRKGAQEELMRGVPDHLNPSKMLSNAISMAKTITMESPHRKATVFVVHKNKRPVGVTLSFEKHEPHSAGGATFAIHSQWERGVPVLGTDKAEQFSRKTGEYDNLIIGPADAHEIKHPYHNFWLDPSGSLHPAYIDHPETMLEEHGMTMEQAYKGGWQRGFSTPWEKSITVENPNIRPNGYQQLTLSKMASDLGLEEVLHEGRARIGRTIWSSRDQLSRKGVKRLYASLPQQGLMSTAKSSGIEGSTKGVTHVLGEGASKSSNLKRGPFVGTAYEKSQYDAPYHSYRSPKGELNQHSMIENHGVLNALRGAGVPVQDPNFGQEAFHRHVEAMGRVLKDNPTGDAANAYMMEVNRIGSGDFDHGALTQAARMLLKEAQADPNNRFLSLYKKMVDAKASKDKPQVTQPAYEPIREEPPTYHDIDLVDEPHHSLTEDEIGPYVPQIPKAIDAPLKLAPMTNELARSPKEGSRLGFMEHLHGKGVSAEQAVQELMDNFWLSPRQARDTWRRFISRKAPKKMSRMGMVFDPRKIVARQPVNNPLMYAHNRISRYMAMSIFDSKPEQGSASKKTANRMLEHYKGARDKGLNPVSSAMYAGYKEERRRQAGVNNLPILGGRRLKHLEFTRGRNSLKYLAAFLDRLPIADSVIPDTEHKQLLEHFNSKTHAPEQDFRPESTIPEDFYA